MDEENEEDQVCIHRWQQQKKGKRGLAAAEWETGSVSEWWPLVAWVIPITKASEGEEGMPWKRKKHNYGRHKGTAAAHSYVRFDLSSL